MLRAYATMTGTRRNLAALRDAGWGVLLNPYVQRDTKGMPYMLDNGAWTMFQIDLARAAGKLPTDAPDRRYPEEVGLEEAFELQFTRLCDRFGSGADYIVVPDIVASPHSLARSLGWLEPLAVYGVPLLIPVQNGMMVEHLQPHIGVRRLWRHTVPVGLFVGGDTEWKLATMQQWCCLAREAGVPCHVGRVNTQQRIRMCLEAGATSFDGTAASRYESVLKDLDMARRGFVWKTRGKDKGQLSLF